MEQQKSKKRQVTQAFQSGSYAELVGCMGSIAPRLRLQLNKDINFFSEKFVMFVRGLVLSIKKSKRFVNHFSAPMVR
jgi:hypothetical protein